ncbi:MAG: methyl-accepting chemotaxis protein, partial [Aeromonas jandaei]
MLTKMTIGQKLIMAFTTLALLMLGFAWFATAQLSNIYRDASEVTDNIVPSIRASSQMHVALLDARRAELNMVIDALGKDSASLSNSTQNFE